MTGGTRHPSAGVYRRRRLLAAAGAVTVGALVFAAVGSCNGPGAPAARQASATPPAGSPAATGAPPARTPAGASSKRPAAPADAPTASLAPGSDPSVLPGPLIIADEDNNRLLEVAPDGRILWRFPQPGDLPPGTSFLLPDDAFFSADGKQIIATEEEDAVVSVIDVASRRIVYRYGTPGRPGSGPNQLANPDDALLLPGGDIFLADIMNCRLLRIRPPAHVPLQVIGTTTSSCLHAPPARFGSPNGAFPMANGDYLVTEINGDWVDEMSLSAKVRWSVHPPGIAYPSDTNEVAPDRYLTVDYSTPGQILIFDRAGRALWRYRPLGAGRLNHPSLALPLPNGDILANDDRNDRVIVVDPRTDRIVWQYGHTGVSGSAPGYLDNPDGVDLAGRYGLLAEFHAAMAGSG